MHQWNADSMQLCSLNNVSKETRSEFPTFYTQVLEDTGYRTLNLLACVRGILFKASIQELHWIDIPCIVDIAENGKVIVILVPILQWFVPARPLSPAQCSAIGAIR